MPVPAQGANPYLRLLYQHLARENFTILPDEYYLRRRWFGRPGAAPRFVHYHWPENKYNHHLRFRLHDRAAIFFAQVELQKRYGAKIVLTLHNVAPHENEAPEFHRRAKARMVALSDLVLINFEAARAYLAREYGRRDHVYRVPHGSYRGYYPDYVSRAEARAQLGLEPDHFVFLLFGDLRRYKNIELVMRAFSANRAAQLRLLVAGAPRPDAYAQALQAAASSDARILLRLGRVEDEQVQVVFRASDVMVLGQETFSSGSAVLGLDFDLPLLGRRTNHVAEIALGRSLLEVDALDEANLARVMLEASRADLREARQDAGRSSQALAWPPIARTLAEVLRRADESAP
jgi:glycosyltransferase involved in cell wall biosynthesis